VNSDNRIRIALYTQLSFVAQGLAAVFRTHADLELVACRDSLSGTLDCLRSTRPDVLLVHLLSESNCRNCRRYGRPTAAARSSCGATNWKASSLFRRSRWVTRHSSREHIDR